MTSDDSDAPHEVEDDESGVESGAEGDDDDDNDDDGEYEVALNDTEAEVGDSKTEDDSDATGETGTESVSEEMSVATFSAINFTEFVEMYEIDCDYTSEEEAVMWFSSEDYSAFLEQCEEKANKITDKHGEENITDNVKVRDLLGLEAWTKEGYKKRQKARLASIDVVLDEQFSQWDDGKEDPESIAALYGQSTEESRLNASTKGKHLERDVKGFLKSTLGDEYEQLKSLSRHGSMSSLGSLGSLDSASINSMEGDDLSDGDIDQSESKKKVVKKKVVKKKTPSDGGWAKVDPKAPQPFNKYNKQAPSTKKLGGSTRSLGERSSASRNLGSQRQLSNSSLNSSNHSKLSVRSAPERGPVRLTPSPPSSIRSMGGDRQRAPPRNKSVGGRRKPAALAAASRLTRQSAQRGGFSPPKKHQPMSGRNVMGNKMLVKKQPRNINGSWKEPELGPVYATGRPGGVRVPLSKAAAEISMNKRGKFTKSEVMPAYNTAVTASTQQKILAKKKKELQAQLNKIEKQEKQMKASTKKLATVTVTKKPLSIKKDGSFTEKEKKKGGLLSKLRGK
jgi:hypothetical protein